MFKKTFYAFALVAFFATAFATETSSADLEFVASNWLKLADTGDENGEWDQASPIFQSHITRPDWVRTIENMRHQLGRTISREVSGVEKKKTLPGMPDGPYAIVRFKSSFEKLPKATEYVTVIQEKDESWKVVWRASKVSVLLITH